MTTVFSSPWRLLLVLVVWTGSSVASESGDYLANRDGITLDAGESIAYNRALQTIDPWPLHAGRTKNRTDGERMLLSIERYQKNDSIEPEGLGGSESEGAGASPASP